MKKISKRTKLIIAIIISIVIVLGIIIGWIFLKNNLDCKWCDDSNTECYIDSNGKTVCSVIDDN